MVPLCFKRSLLLQLDHTILRSMQQEVYCRAMCQQAWVDAFARWPRIDVSQNWKERKAAYEQVQILFQQAQSDDSDDFREYGKSSSTGMLIDSFISGTTPNLVELSTSHPTGETAMHT